MKELIEFICLGFLFCYILGIVATAVSIVVEGLKTIYKCK